MGKRDKSQKARVWERVKARKGDKSSKSSLNTAVWKPLVSRAEGLQLSNALLQLFFFFFMLTQHLLVACLSSSGRRSKKTWTCQSRGKLLWKLIPR